MHTHKRTKEQTQSDSDMIKRNQKRNKTQNDKCQNRCFNLYLSWANKRNDLRSKNLIHKITFVFILYRKLNITHDLDILKTYTVHF